MFAVGLGSNKIYMETRNIAFHSSHFNYIFDRFLK